MMNLALTTDKLSVITSSTAGIDVHASWVDDLAVRMPKRVRSHFDEIGDVIVCGVADDEGWCLSRSLQGWRHGDGTM